MDLQEFFEKWAVVNAAAIRRKRDDGMYFVLL